MRLILALALLLTCSAGLHAQDRATPSASVAEAAASATELPIADAPPPSAVAPAEHVPASGETDARRTAPIFDREFVRHVAAMVIAGVLVAVILRAIF